LIWFLKNSETGSDTIMKALKGPGHGKFK
jgi:hypothetical protein